MVKKGIKLLVIVLTIFLFTFILFGNGKVFASNIDVTEDPDFWSDVQQTAAGDTFTGIIKIIVSTVRYVGMIVSVIALSIIGLRYMTGSVEEKAQYKQTLFPWFIGAIMVFAITTIPTLIITAADK